MLDVEELLELEDNIRKELDDHLPAALSMLNRTGELETFLKMLGMEDLLQSKPLYQVYKTGKIIVIGRSDVKAEVLLSIAKSLGLSKDRFELYLDYEDGKTFDFENKNGLDYVLTDHYYLPALRLPEDKRPIGRWGRLRKEYLKTYRPVLYQALFLSGKLYTILADLDEQAAERCSLIVQQMAQAEGITEELKAADPVRWVQAMNSIRSRAEEIIQAEMIYV